MIQYFRSNGKLMLTGEYLVLDGANSLAFPTKKGQRLSIEKSEAHNTKIEWKSYSCDGELWFEALFDKNFQILYASDDEVGKTLQKMLIVCGILNPEFIESNTYYEAKNELEFNQEWGLGSSSTLISNLAQWAEVNPFDILDQAFSGSGYDLACASAQGPILFHRSSDEVMVKEVEFNPSFRNDLWFVYLEQKQKSSKEIVRYKELDFDRSSAVQSVDELTQNIINASNVYVFNALLQEHEELLSSVLGIETVQKKLFSDYSFGVVKSLGAWGGDFVLISGKKDQVFPYFKNKGYTTIVSWEEMIY